MKKRGSVCDDAGPRWRMVQDVEGVNFFGSSSSSVVVEGADEVERGGPQVRVGDRQGSDEFV